MCSCIPHQHDGFVHYTSVATFVGTTFSPLETCDWYRFDKSDEFTTWLKPCVIWENISCYCRGVQAQGRSILTGRFFWIVFFQESLKWRYEKLNIYRVTCLVVAGFQENNNLSLFCQPVSEIEIPSQEKKHEGDISHGTHLLVFPGILFKFKSDKYKNWSKSKSLDIDVQEMAWLVHIGCKPSYFFTYLDCQI